MNVSKMTNEEKFEKGIVVYIDDSKNIICELWGSSTKHPNTIYSMNRDIEYGLFNKNPYAEKLDCDIYQWLLCIASRQMWKSTAKKIVEIANEYY